MKFKMFETSSICKDCGKIFKYLSKARQGKYQWWEFLKKKEVCPDCLREKNRIRGLKNYKKRRKQGKE